MQTIEVCGRNNNFSLGEKSNHRTREGDKYIYPACKSDLDPTTLNSYSIFNKTVAVTKEGEAMAIGDNTKSQISGSLPKQILKTFHDITLVDKNNQPCSAISAVCGLNYALYLIQTKEDDPQKQLAYAHSNLDREYPVVLNIGDSIPISIYGGYSDCAAITSVGSIIYLHDSICETLSNKFEAVLLPENEKAINIVCCYNSVFVLTLSGRVFESKKEPILVFNEIKELKGKKIQTISGTFQHCLAVTTDGKVFVRGCDFCNCGCLGLGKERQSPDKFKEIKALSKFHIEAAYAGTSHSLFLTDDGSLLGCGDNKYGQIFLGSGPCKEKTFKPVETTVKDAKFCIVGDSSTVIFKNDMPSMCPNREIKFFN